MSVTPEHAQQVLSEAECLYSRAQVAEAIVRMAGDISERLAHSNPLVLCVMTGALIPTGELLPLLEFPLELDYVHATRYGAQLSGGQLKWLAGPCASLTGRHVLVVDDILDEGDTLAGIVAHCRDAGAVSVHSAVLVEKLHQRKNGFQADFVALTVEDRYVFGYGMDYKGYLRNAPGIYAVKGT